MLFIFSSTLAFILVLLGIGRLVGMVIGLKTNENPWIWFWFGFFCLSTAGMALSMVIRLEASLLYAAIGLALLGLPQLSHECYAFFKQKDTFLNALFFGLLTSAYLFIVYMLSVSEWIGQAYDTDLYHSQIIRWLNEYGTPLGLGNIHVRLANNSAWHIVAALFDNAAWNDRSAWLMPALAIIGGIGYFGHVMCFSRFNWARVYAFCILLWIYLYILNITPSLYFDFPALLINAIVVLECLQLCLVPSYRNKENFCIIVCLSASAFMVKPISAVSLLFANILVATLLAQDSFFSWKKFLSIWVLAFCAGVIWVSRNLILSGYPLFPLPLFPLNFDWTIPVQYVSGAYQDIMAWARMPGSGYRTSLENGFLYWAVPWIQNNLHSKFVLMTLFMPFLCGSVAWLFSRKNCNRIVTMYFGLWSVTNIVYWFILAPDPRFGDGFFWVYCALGVSFILELFNFSVQRHVWVVGLASICILFLLGVIISKRSSIAQRDWINVPTMPSKVVKEYHIKSLHPDDGIFTLWIPQDSSDDRCGNAPLPCVPRAIDNVRLRVKNTMEKGFKTIKRE